ncbi:FtsJ methyltransferase domain-containing protein 2 [Podila humilis]|nr:FtsJ methyltransferase domain-containing protein 2 [Podila humilis]
MSVEVDSDPAYAATPLLSSTDIPTIQNCPRVRFQQGNNSNQHHNNSNRGGPNFPFGGPSQVPLRYDPQRGLQPQGYGGHPPNSYLNPHQQHPPHFQHQQQHQPPQVPPQSQLMRPMIPPTEFIDQHLDVFQATTYDLPEGCFKIQTGPAEDIDFDMFCVKDIVETLLDSKKKLREVPQEKFSRARQRCNPYELVGSSIFMNRASVKLASIDCQLALTANKEDPSDGQDEQISKTFRFADLCSGPGGFSEYLLWRKHTWGEKARGWAITLKGDLDFALDRFHRDTAVHESLKTFYGADGTGNLLSHENIQAFADLIETESAGLGVGLVSADGGISVDGDEAVQETLLQRLILCQILTMFKVLQKSGDFVVKIFDIFTPVTAGLVWILSRYFEKICVVKPLTSRPMNSERYVVCRHLLERKPAKVIEHLTKVNEAYQELEDKTAQRAAVAASTATEAEAQISGEKSVESVAAAPTVKDDLIHLVDLKSILLDSHFMEYIKRNNTKTAIRQTEALDVFLKYVNEGIRPAFDQEAIKKVCQQEWRIPPRPQPVHPQYHQQQQQMRQMQQQQQQHPHHGHRYQNQQQPHHHHQHGSQHPQHQHRSGPPPGHHPYQIQQHPQHHQASRGGHGYPQQQHQHQPPPQRR